MNLILKVKLLQILLTQSALHYLIPELNVFNSLRIRHEDSMTRKPIVADGKLYNSFNWETIKIKPATCNLQPAVYTVRSEIGPEQ